MNEAIETKKGMGRVDLGYLISLSLRKSCDSAPTSLVYVLIGITEFNQAWGRYLDLVWDELSKENKLSIILERASQNLSYNNQYESALRIGFRLFSTLDWECLESGIEYFLKKSQD